MSKKIKVCLVSLYSYPLFNSACQGIFGGSEVRVSIIARGLAINPDLDVNLIVFNYGQPEVERIDGVTVYAWKERLGPKNNPDDQDQDQDQGKKEDSAVSSYEQSETVAPPPSFFHSSQLKIRHLLRRLYLGIKWRLLSNYVGQLIPLKISYFARRLHWGIKWRLQSLYNRLMVKLRSIRILNLVIFLLRNPYKFTRLNAIVKESAEEFRGSIELDRIGNFSIYQRNIAMYEKVDADLYIVPGNSELTAEIAYFCKIYKKKSILLAGSDMDYDPQYKINPSGHNRYGSPHNVMTYAIDAVDAHSVQNERQAELLLEAYGRNSTIIKNPISMKAIGGTPLPERDILWVGKSDTIKRPEIVLDMARRMPEFSFTIIMVRSNKEIHSQILRMKEELSNVKIIEYVPFEEIERYFAAHRILINTSTIEGFPNTFLQSIKYGRPVISLKVDPGSVLSSHGCGGCADGDFEKMFKLTNYLLQDDDEYELTRRKCLSYISEYHDHDRVVARYVELIRMMVDDAS